MMPIFMYFPQERLSHGTRDSWSWLGIRLMKALRNPRTRTVYEGRYRGIAEYADCGQQAAAQRYRWERASEHVVASESRRGGATASRRSESKLGSSRAGPGRRPVILESRGPGLADGGRE